MAYQKGFAADIEFYEEQTFGGGLYDPAAADTMKRISDTIVSASLTANNNAEVIFSIGDVNGVDTIDKQHEYTLRIEYLLQDAGAADQLIKYGITRNSDNDLDSLVFLVQIGDYYYEIKGCKCNSVEITGDVGEIVRVTQEFFCKEVTSPSTTDPLSSLVNLSHASAIGTSYAKYSGASITRGGSTIGYGTRSFSATINNNLERVYTVGDTNVSTIVAGKLEISGNIDVYIEEGGAAQWGWITGASSANIVIDFGFTSPSLTLTNCTFSSIELPMNNSDAIVVTGLPFIGEDASLT